MILLCAAVKIRVLVQSAETDDSKQSVCELRYSNKHSFSRYELSFSYLSKIIDCYLSHSRMAPPLGITYLNFTRMFHVG